MCICESLYFVEFSKCNGTEVVKEFFAGGIFAKFLGEKGFFVFLSGISSFEGKEKVFRTVFTAGFKGVGLAVYPFVIEIMEFVYIFALRGQNEKFVFFVDAFDE